MMPDEKTIEPILTPIGMGALPCETPGTSRTVRFFATACMLPRAGAVSDGDRPDCSRSPPLPPACMPKERVDAGPDGPYPSWLLPREGVLSRVSRDSQKGS